MREIKFRAWDGHKIFYQSDNTASAMNGLEYFATLVGQVKGRTPDVMQFTGLKDKDGKDIYEGDIVMYENDYPGSYYPPEAPEPHNDFAIVEWSEEARWNLNSAFKDNRSDSADWIHEYGNDLEIIGNIYENPELLKTK